MANSFDFTLTADDQVSDALKRINDEVRNLQPGLDKTTDGLKLGGQETNDGLSQINRMFEQLGRYAKDNVQFIGDMVPPLRNFTGFTGRMGGIVGKMGLAGGAAYLAGKGMKALGSGISDAADDAYGLQVAAENAGMSVKDFSQLSGAMRMLGTDSETARGEVQGFYKTFNDALQGRNNEVLAVMNQVHAQIVKNADGTANVLETVKQLADVFPKLSPQNQKTVADALGLDADGLQLLREGKRLKDNLTKSDSVGLTIDPKVNAELVGLNRTLTELSASWDGLKTRTEQGIAHKLLSDGTVTDGLKGASKVMQNPRDPMAWSQAAGFISDQESGWLKRAQKDDAFLKSLPAGEAVDIMSGMVNTSSEHNHLRQQYGLRDQASQLMEDMKAAQAAAAGAGNPVQAGGGVNAGALSVVNNNPWNIRYASQANAEPGAKGFAKFDSLNNGVLAADRQLQLYYSGKSANTDHPLRTLQEIISTASPVRDHNNTPQMIKDASRELGIAPDAQMDLSSPGMRSRVLAALFNREGNNSLSSGQIQNIIQQSPQQPLTPPPLLPGTGATGAQASDPAQLANALSAVLAEKGIKVELTMVNEKTGQRQTVTGTGSRISTAMQFP